MHARTYKLYAGFERSCYCSIKRIIRIIISSKAEVRVFFSVKYNKARSGKIFMKVNDFFNLVKLF